MKTITTIALVLCSIVTFGQTKPDTSKRLSFSMTEINQIQNTLYQAIGKIHTVDMSSRKRDSIDNMMGAVYNFILKRETDTYHPKSPQKEGGKKQ